MRRPLLPTQATLDHFVAARDILNRMSIPKQGRSFAVDGQVIHIRAEGEVGFVRGFDVVQP